MTNEDIIRLRLLNQQIALTKLKTPQSVVTYMGAMQAQEYAMAKWAIGLRLPETITEPAVEKAFNEGKILRTHMLRPTWHFVSPKDIRWMQKLTSPRVQAFNAYYYKKDGLNAKIFSKCHRVLIKALERKNYLTREELKNVLEQNKITATGGQRLASIMMHAELEGLICSGPRKGKQFTYALSDERTPNDKKEYIKEEALHRLTNLYFTTRGPASPHDFSWWSGLSVAEAKQGILSLGKKFEHVTIDGKTYTFLPQKTPDLSEMQGTFLFPDYDEYGICYKDRSAYMLETKGRKKEFDPFAHMLVVDGKMAGTWKTDNKKTFEITTDLFFKPSKSQQMKIKSAIARYRNFFGA